MTLCIYAPGPWGDCFDAGCRGQGGKCVYVGGPGGRTACRCVTAAPSPNRANEGTSVDSALLQYRRVVDEQPPCDAPWFTEALANYRAGDESAGREISGRCLRVALRLADSLPRPAGWDELDWIQEANGGLMTGLRTFTGSGLDEFLTHTTLAITRHLEHVAAPAS